MSDRRASLPPGKPGLPIVGETLTVLRDPFGFVETRARQYGPIFRTRLLGREAVVITGPDAAAKFVDDADVQRGGAMPGNVEALFGGRTLPVLDGEEHHARKAVVMAGFSREAVAAALPRIRARLRGALARWSEVPEIRAVDETRRLAIETICEVVLGIEGGPALGEILADYGLVLRGFSALPVPLPGTAYSKAKAALGRILGRWRAEIARHEQANSTIDDGLSLMLAARGASPTPDADALAREIHHVVLAGLIVWAWCTRALLELDRHPEVFERLRAECARFPVEAGLDTIESLPYLATVAREVRRISAVVPLSFGKARRTFAFGGYEVPAGWMVLWAPSASHARPEVYAEPERFDPDRFGPARAEHARHPHAFVPNGTGEVVRGHKCAGYLFAPALLEVFLIELARGYDWKVPTDQDLSYVWTETPPPHKDGLRLSISRRPEPSVARRTPSGELRTLLGGAEIKARSGA
jgi:cytochrome P450